MPGINGTTVIYSHGGTAIAMLTNTTLNINGDLPDSSNKDDLGWANHIYGQRSWDISVDGVASFVATTGNIAVLSAAITGRTSVAIKFAPSTAGQVQFTGSASVNGLTISAPNEDTVTISGTITGNGVLTVGTVS
jgi:predicted secreted protein